MSDAVILERLIVLQEHSININAFAVDSVYDLAKMSAVRLDQNTIFFDEFVYFQFIFCVIGKACK